MPRVGGGKSATRGALGDAAPPGPEEAIVRALGVSGNQVEVQRPDGTTAFALLPARFNKRLWIKRGGYLVVTAPPAVAAAAAAAPAAAAPRVQGEVVAVLYAGDVARMRRMEGVWPAEFGEEEEGGGVGAESDGDGVDDGGSSGGSSSGLPPLEANPNRRRPTYASSSSSSEEEG